MRATTPGKAETAADDESFEQYYAFCENILERFVQHQ